jgi:transposase
MTRLRGRAPRGERLIAKVPHGRRHTTTLIAALDLSGMRCSMVVDGPVNADVFTAFVEQVLCPELRPGDIVALDNLASHKVAAVRRLIEARGASVLLLPPSSPDLNPIEMIFSKVKQTLRSMACRRKDALWNAMHSALNKVPPTDAANCFKHCGYTRCVE